MDNHQQYSDDEFEPPRRNNPIRGNRSFRNLNDIPHGDDRRNNRRDTGDRTRTASRREDAPRNQRGNYQEDRSDSEYTRERQVRGDYSRDPLPRKPSYRDALMNSRPNSRTNLLPRKSNLSVSRRSSHHERPRQNEDRDQLLRVPDRNTRNPPRSHPNSEETQPKNGKAPIGGAHLPAQASSSKRATNQEMLDFIRATMLNLENFRDQLTN